MTSTTEFALPDDPKVQQMGREGMPAERREAMLHEFACSCMSGAAINPRHGIKHQIFAWWRQKHHNLEAAGTATGWGSFRPVETLEGDSPLCQRSWRT